MAAPAILAQLAAMIGPKLVSKLLTDRDFKREQSRLDRQQAQQKLIGSLSNRQGSQVQQPPTQPGLASSLAGDPLVQGLMGDLIKKLFSSRNTGVVSRLPIGGVGGGSRLQSQRNNLLS
jgi:hypothetical protein